MACAGHGRLDDGRPLVVELAAGHSRPLDVVHVLVAVVQLGAGPGRVLGWGARGGGALGAGYGRRWADGARQLERTGRGR